MKIRHLTLSIAVFSLSLVFFTSQVFPGLSGEDDKERILLETMMAHIERLHFDPLELDREFSQVVFDEYIHRLDRNKRFFTEEDLNELRPYRDRLHSQIAARDFEFFELSLAITERAVKRAYDYYRQGIEGDFTINRNGEIELDSDNVNFAANSEELLERWKEYLHFQVMDEVVKKVNRAERNEESYDIDTFYIAAVETVEERFDNWLERVKKNTREDRFNTYLNTIANVHDPHTGYFKPKEKEDFNMRMSNQLEGIGARLTTEGDFVKIVNIVPGGPAWRQGDLEQNDLILKVAQEGEDPVDITGWSLDDVVSLIRGPKGTIVTLTVRKIDNKIEEIEIERDVVVFEEGFARSVILEREDRSARVGYINLPSFYFNIGGSGKDRNSKDDVRKELMKLNEEGVDGVILDLRNNGGGSLNDVVDMTGFFIEDGPVVQVKARTGQPLVLDDKDGNVVYDGPLIVMVNSFSASASEILAAALQDYGRAIVVGGNSTFGKGTVQRFYDLDRMLRGNSEHKPLGEVKVTTQKFYRIDGGSTQLKGVQPDIVLPDNFHFTEVGERDYDFAMDWTEIKPVPFSQDVFVIDSDMIKWLEQRSKSRISESEIFGKVVENAKRLSSQRENSIRPLDLDSYREFLQKREDDAERFRGMFDDSIEGMVIENLMSDMDFIHSDSSRIARNESFIENVSKDIYIFESLAIMDDLITVKDKKAVRRGDE